MTKALSHKFNPTATLTGAATLALLGVLVVAAPSATGNHLPETAIISEGNDDAYGEAVCIVTGAAGTAASPVDSIGHDVGDDDEALDPTNLNDTDGGQFDFASDTVVCAGSDEGGEAVGTVASPDFEIAAGEASRLGESEYTNLVCGTGHAEGTADLWTPGTPGAPHLPADQHATDLKTRFAISFVGGIGPLAITSFEGHVSLDETLPTPQSDPDEVPGPIPPAEPDQVQDVDTGHGTGVVQITPDPDGGVAEGPNPDGNPDNTGGPPSTTDPGDPGPPPFNSLPPEPCVNQGVAGNPGQNIPGFVVAAAFVATLSGDTDVANDDNE